MAMHTVTSIEIARPAADVFAVVADMSRNTEWQEGMKSCRWTSEPPIGVGSTYEQVAVFRGKEIVTKFRVEEYDPGALIRMVSTQSTFPLDVTRRVEPRGDGRCRVTAVVKGEPGGLLKLLGPLTKRMVKRSVRADYQRLKAHLEG